MSNGLPVLHNLEKWKIQADPTCPLCFGSKETIFHVFCCCDFARLVWAISGLHNIAIYNQNTDIWDWIVGVKHELSSEQFVVFFCICLCLWHHRNNVVHNNHHDGAKELVQFGVDYLHRFREAQHHCSAPRPPESDSHWTPPTGSCIKINVDASILKQHKATGIGVIARDSSGHVLAWRQRKIDFIQSPELAELVQGVDLAVSAGWREVIIESDCQSIIRDVNSRETCLSAGGHFIEDIKNKSCLFHSIAFRHLFRDANSLAHELSKQVIRDIDGSTSLM